MQFLTPDHLKSACLFVLLSNPLTKDEFQSIESDFGIRCRFSSQGGMQYLRGDLQQPMSISTPPVGRCGTSVAFAFSIAVLRFFAPLP
jgi:hypothetical protein